MKPLRIVLVDDHALVRAGIRKLLESLPYVEVLGEAEDGRSLLEMVGRLRPSLVLMDISMPGINGLETTKRLTTDWPEMRVLILSMHQSDEYVRQALRNGAVGYLLKDAAPLEFEMALKAVQRGETYLGPSVSKGVISDYVHRLRSDKSEAAHLTPRQREVLQLIAQGLSTKEVARYLNLSVKTVDTHRSHLMKQLDIHEVAGLVRYAMRFGLISPDQ